MFACKGFFATPSQARRAHCAPGEALNLFRRKVCPPKSTRSKNACLQGLFCDAVTSSACALRTGRSPEPFAERFAEQSITHFPRFFNPDIHIPTSICKKMIQLTSFGGNMVLFFSQKCSIIISAHRFRSTTIDIQLTVG